MRADAERNVDKLRAAAAELFQEQGLQVSLREISRRAGVSHGTLYNLFGSREALIDDVVADLAASRLDEVAEHALACENPWDGFAYYVETICAIQGSDPALADVLSGRYPGAERLMTLCGRASSDAAKIVDRAQRSGSLRADFTGEDLALTFGAIAQLARAGAGVAPDAWRRSVALLLDGLRSGAAHQPLPEALLSPDQIFAVLGRLHGKS